MRIIDTHTLQDWLGDHQGLKARIMEHAEVGD